MIVSLYSVDQCCRVTEFLPLNLFKLHLQGYIQDRDQLPAHGLVYEWMLNTSPQESDAYKSHTADKRAQASLLHQLCSMFANHVDLFQKMFAILLMCLTMIIRTIRRTMSTVLVGLVVRVPREPQLPCSPLTVRLTWLFIKHC